MTIARGAYLGFVDADDWIEPGMYETLYHAVNIKNYDLGICNVNQFVETVNVFSNRINLENATMDLHKNKKEELIQFLHFRYDNANWNKLYRCSLIKKYTIRFNETMRLWEDLLFNLVYLQYASTAVIVDKVFYNYRVHAASSMTAQSGKVSENFNKFYSEFIYAASKEGHNELVNTFCQEMNDSFIGNVINAIGIFASKKPGFWGFIQQSSAIFKEVDSRIYLTGNPKKGLVSRINKYLLRHGAFSLLSFLIATRIYSGLKIWTW
jgi:glycosyltransferase involved in cell wall biosynthesis